MPPWRWNCGVCRQQITSRPTKCNVCNGIYHMHCFDLEHFWTRQPRSLCRNCITASQIEQATIQRIERDIYDETNTLMAKLQELRMDISGTEDAASIPALVYYYQLLTLITKTLNELRPL